MQRADGGRPERGRRRPVRTDGGENEREGDPGNAGDDDAVKQRVTLPRAARNTLEDEIESCQNRIVRVLVPTIISFGISAVGKVGVADQSLNYDVLFGALFAVQFSSSLYIAALSYKIFERAAFLRVLSGDETDWENVVAEYRDRHAPWVIGSETTAIGWVYVVLALMFGALFWGKMAPAITVVATIVLLAIGVRIWIIPQSISETRIDRQVRDSIDRLEE